MKVMKDMKHSVGRQRARRPVQFVFMPFMFFMVSIALGAQKPAPQSQAPVFKTKVDVVQLDVSVLDKNRQPVRGLTEKDFTILEDGKPQPIVGFSTFDLDEAAAPATGWMRDVPQDVTTNELKESRLFIIVMDDALIPQEPFGIKSSQEIVNSIIDKLGPDDLTAIVFTGDNRKTQDFTNDKTKLRAAVANFHPGLAGWRFGTDAPAPVAGADNSSTPFPVDTDLWFYQSSVRVLESLADYLVAVPNRRKALFWVSPGVPMDLISAVPSDRYGNPLVPASQTISLTGAGGGAVTAARNAQGAMIDLRVRTEEVFARAQRANVTIYPIDPMGLGGMKNYLWTRLGPENYNFALHKATIQQDYLAAAAANTGGRTVMNTNDFEPGITAVFEENKSYYLIGFEPTNGVADGTLRKIEVKVNRPDVEVRTRSSYYAPKPEDTAKKPDAKNAMTPEAAALAKAMSGILPLTGMPMRVAVAPFAVPGQHLSTVAIVLGIRQPIPAAAANGRVTETTELLTSAFTPEGAARGAQRHTARVVLRAGSNGEAAYEVLARIDLPPGRYELRLAAHNGTSGRDGSVFTDVVVPDYSNVPFSASPVVLSATPGRVSAPKDLLSPLLPFVPTAEREFVKTDRVTAFLRLYQSGQKPVGRVPVSIRIRDASDQVKVDDKQDIEVGAFRSAGQEVMPQTTPVLPPTRVAPPTATPTPTPDRFANLSLRTADVKYQIPLSTLSPGPHLLTIEATLGTTIIRRDVRFAVK